MNDSSVPADDARRSALPAQSGPGILASTGSFDAAVFSPAGREISLAQRELIALAVSLTMQCGYCVDAHSANAKAAGATEAELAEAAWVAMAVRAGGGITFGRLTFALTDGHEH